MYKSSMRTTSGIILQLNGQDKPLGKQAFVTTSETKERKLILKAVNTDDAFILRLKSADGQPPVASAAEYGCWNGRRSPLEQAGAFEGC